MQFALKRFGIIKISMVVFLCLTGSAALPQQAPPSNNKQAQKLYIQSGQSVSYQFYDKAIEQLTAAVKIDPLFISAWQRLGDIYRKLKNYKEAESCYHKVISINPEFHSLTYFGLAESELNQGKYQQALEHFTKYQAYPNLPESNKANVQKYIDDCRFSMAAIKQPVDFSPRNLGPGINTAEQEYLPVVTADLGMLVFTRQANRNEDFFKSTRQGDTWETAEYLSKNINTQHYNEGAQCISPDGMYLFFTGCNRPDSYGRCDIYVSRREGSDWGKPYNIGPPVNTPGWESQPSLSADGRTLYFVSTRPGGMGGYDIWRSELQEGGSWSNPENLGPNINTPYDEQSPFIHPDGQTLYFSSNGWPGFGNKDLYLSRKDTSGNWMQPQNLGYPINTFKEESSLTISSDGQTAFFASDKEGGFGGLDIYSFTLPEKLQPRPVTYVKGTVSDKATGQLLNAEIKIIRLDNNKVIYEDISDYNTGEFLATMPLGNTFALHAAKEGYLFYSENFSLDKPGTQKKPFHIRVELQKINPNEKMVLKNIFFETNQYHLLPQSEAELQQLIAFLTVNPKVVIEIGGHTDNVGDEKSNQVLSENRAKTVYAYLLEHRITPARISYKGYGEKMPVADNQTEEGRQANRRTEFRIVAY